ncbi:MAG: glycosyltransferase [Syntrophomonadaceae bacterium]|nr:glycosyltransferase [Syntrophomonadaceae bacterium]
MSEAVSVSILMNCYNSERFLQETLDSLFKQTWQNWQLVFVDNCSTDNSSKMISQYRHDERVNYIMTPHHMSLGEARDFGLDYCQGKYICFLDTDDLWDSAKLKKQVVFLDKHPDALLTYSGCYFINENSKITGKRDLAYKYGNLFGINLANYEINIPTLMIRRDALGMIDKPYFDPLLKFAEDNNLAMRLLACGPAACQPEKLVYYRQSRGSLTNKTVDLWGPEMEYTFKKLDALGVLIPNSSKKQRQLALAKIAYYKAVYLVQIHEFKQAAALLKEYRFSNLKYYLLYWASYSPALWSLAHHLRSY